MKAQRIDPFPASQKCQMKNHTFKLEPVSKQRFFGATQKNGDFRFWRDALSCQQSALS